MSNNPILLVGFGGAGIQTLDAFDALIAANRSLACNRSDNVYYCVVDTEDVAIQRFQRSIIKRGRGAGCPYVATCCLSQDIQNFDEIVRPVFDRFYGHPNDAGLSRIREHWWFDADGRPFRGWDGLNVMYGSGRSPSVAFSLAWYQMRKIEESLCELIDEIKRRSIYGQSVISRLRIYFVTSLAGGTGRGSWAPVMLKIKEILGDRGSGCFTTGLFFDASIFVDAVQGSPNDALTHKVNSLTGLSELSFWIGDDMRRVRRVPISVRLPDMVSPTNPEKDVLNIVDENQLLHSVSPVDNAYLIFGQSPASCRLASSNEYFQVAGRGLFSLYETSEIEAGLINDPCAIRSFATTSLMVDVAGLGAYFNYFARKSVLAGIISESDDVDAHVDEFLKRIFFPRPIREESDIRPDFNGTLMQRACANLNASKGEEYSRLRERLSMLQPKRAFSDVQSLSRSVVDSVTEIDVNNAVSSAVESLRARYNGKELDLRRELLLELQSICKGDEGEKLSVGRVRKFIRQLLEKIDGLNNSSIAEFSFGDPSVPDSVGKLSAREWIDRVVYNFSKRTLVEVITGRPPFNKEKVSELVRESECGWAGLVPHVVLCDVYPRLRRRLWDFFEPLRTLVREVLNSCDRVLAWSKEVDALLSQRLMREIGCGTHEELFHRIFTTPDRIFSELPSVDSMAVCCQTILKPIVRGRQEVGELLLKSDSIIVGKGLYDLLLEALNCATDDCPRLRGDGSAHKECMTKEDIYEVIMSNVNVSGCFIEEKFSLLKVLARNRDFWNCQIKNMSDSAEYLHAFFGRLSALFGATPEWLGAGGVRELPLAEDLLVSATCTLVQRCQPWWNIARDEDGTDCYIVVPSLDLQSLHWERICDSENLCNQSNRKVTVLVRQSHENPYEVVVFAMQNAPLGCGEDRHPFDDIKSLDYWKDPGVVEILREAERADGKLVFSRGGHSGLGYISPRFVRDSQLSSMRWKPWVENESKDEMLLDLAASSMNGGSVARGSANQAEIFISYSRKDLDKVKPIKEELEGYGLSCWIDIDGIESGEANFKRKIIPALNECKIVLFFISVDSQKSEWVAKELGYARRHEKRVVPLRFNDDKLVGEFDFDYGEANIIDWRCAEQRQKLIKELGLWVPNGS